MSIAQKLDLHDVGFLALGSLFHAANLVVEHGLDSSCARFSSSSLIFFSLASFLRWSLPSRRTLRSAVLWSSSSWLSCLTTPRRRSSVMGGIGTRSMRAVALRIEAVLGRTQRLFDLLQQARVPGLNQDEIRLGSGHLCNLGQRRRRAVVVDAHLVEQLHAGAAGAQRNQMGLEIRTALSMRRFKSACNSLSTGFVAINETAISFLFPVPQPKDPIRHKCAKVILTNRLGKCLGRLRFSITLKDRLRPTNR
jgi:hypothetical protein